MEKKEIENMKNGKISIKIMIIVLVVILVVVFICLYNFNYQFRNNINGLISQNINVDTNGIMINIDQDAIKAIFGYSEYLSVLKQNNIYGFVDGKEKFVNSVAINNPVYCACEKYLAIAEKGSNKVYVYNGENLIFEKDVGGNITGLSINKNGYLAVIMNKSGYRSVITVYNKEGIEMFSTYLSSTYASQVLISPNNKNMVFVEVDTSGIQVISKIKFIQIDKVNEVTQTINAVKHVNNIIADINFASNDEVIYLTDVSVNKVDINGNYKELLSLIDKDIVNIDISQGEYIVRSEKIKSGILNTSTNIIILDKNGEDYGKYTVDGIVKQMKVKNNVIASNVGQQLYFITINGRPIKKFISNSDIKDVVIYGEGKMAALIYRNKIEIINI